MNRFEFFKTQGRRLCVAAAVALVGFAMASCAHLFGQGGMPATPPPPPTSLTITGIPENHNGRQAEVRLLDANGNAFAIAGSTQITDGSVVVNMLNPATRAPIVARGNFAVDFVITTAVFGRENPVPAFMGQATPRNFTEGGNNVAFSTFAPTPVSITVTGIPAAHNGRLATARLVCLETGRLEVANAPYAQISNGAATMIMMNTETQAEFFARGTYVVGITISGVLMGRTMPLLAVITERFEITGGSQTIPFSYFVGSENL